MMTAAMYPMLFFQGASQAAIAHFKAKSKWSKGKIPGRNKTSSPESERTQAPAGSGRRGRRGSKVGGYGTERVPRASFATCTGKGSSQVLILSPARNSPFFLLFLFLFVFFFFYFFFFSFFFF
jgi:hypothetical protein